MCQFEVCPSLNPWIDWRASRTSPRIMVKLTGSVPVTFFLMRNVALSVGSAREKREPESDADAHRSSSASPFLAGNRRRYRGNNDQGSTWRSAVSCKSCLPSSKSVGAVSQRTMQSQLACKSDRETPCESNASWAH